MSEKDVMKVILAAAVLFLGAILIVSNIKRSSDMHPNDTAMRNEVVKLYNPEKGTCSGVFVRGASGKTYVLSAGHCHLILTQNNQVFAQMEDGTLTVLDALAEDETSDLLIFSTDFKRKGATVATTVEKHQHIRTLTHGKGQPTYRTEGEMLGIDQIEVQLFPITSEEAETTCKKLTEKYSKYHSFVLKLTMSGLMPDMDMGACTMTTIERYSTADVAPGSSGGPVFNDNDELVGIVSSRGENFSGFVILEDIHSFLLKF